MKHPVLYPTLVTQPHAADGAVSPVKEPGLEDLAVEPLVLLLVHDGDQLDAELVAPRLGLGPVVHVGRVQLQVVALVAFGDHVELAEIWNCVQYVYSKGVLL